MDRRALAGLAAGLAGLGTGAAAAALSAPVLALVAGACAFAAAVAAVALGRALVRRSAEAAEVRAGLAELEVEVGKLRQAVEAGREAIRVAGTFADLVAQRNLELTRSADNGLQDELTGLPDSRYFEPALHNRVAAARRLLRPVSIVLLEVHGEAMGDGDAGMRALARVLRATLREADTACRVAQHRFGLVLEDTPEGGAVWAAERIRTAFTREGGPVNLLSAGVASYPSHALDAGDLLHRAERALERARSSGRGKVEVAPAVE